MRKACQIGLVTFFVLLGLTLLWAFDVYRVQVRLNHAYWLRENDVTISGFEEICIPYIEERLHQRTTELTALAASLAIFSVVGLLVCKYASKKHVIPTALLLLFLLLLTPLPATARLDVNTLKHCYACKFMVLGGDPDPDPPDDDDDSDGGGGGFNIYPTPLDERQRPEQ